jgi:hypothetical protein
MNQREWSLRERSRWGGDDIDGQTREGEASGKRRIKRSDIDGKPEGGFRGEKTS